MSGIVKTVKKIVTKPLSGIADVVTDAATIAAGVSGLGIGGTLGSVASSILGPLKLGGTLGKVLGEDAITNKLSDAALNTLLGGGESANGILSILAGGTVDEAQKQFITMALNGGMTADEIANDKSFRELNYKNATGSRQTAEEGLAAFKQAQSDLAATGKAVGNLQMDTTGATQALAGSQALAAQQQAGINKMAGQTANTATQKAATGALAENASNISGTISGMRSAIQGLMSSYGMRNVSQGTGGTSLGEPSTLQAGFNQTLGVAQGDAVTAARQALAKSIAQARAAGASVAQLAEMQRRGEADIQEQASRMAIANEREGANAAITAMGNLTPLLEQATSNAATMSQTDLAMQQLDQQWQQMAQTAIENMRNQGLSEAQIAAQIAQAQANYDLSKSTLQSQIQQSIASGNLNAANLSLQDVQNAMSTIGSSLNAQKSATSQGLNAASNAVSQQTQQNIANQKALGAMGGTTNVGSSDILGSIGQMLGLGKTTTTTPATTATTSTTSGLTLNLPTLPTLGSTSLQDKLVNKTTIG